MARTTSWASDRTRTKCLDALPLPCQRGRAYSSIVETRDRHLSRRVLSSIGTSGTVSAMHPLRVMGRSDVSRMPVLLRSSKSRADVSFVRDTAPIGVLVPPDPPLAGLQAALRPFRVGDAAAIAESCRDPDIPRFTMMPEAMTEDQARRWVERGLEWWPRGLARFAVTVPPSDQCAGQIGIQFDFARVEPRRSTGLIVGFEAVASRWRRSVSSLSGPFETMESCGYNSSLISTTNARNGSPSAPVSAARVS
jgi:hypothetical protein